MLICVFWVCLILYTSPATGVLQNVALKKPCTGSNSYASYINDGSTDEYRCSFMMDTYSKTVEWVVDLENYHEISAVNIYTRANSLENHDFDKFYVYVTKQNPHPVGSFHFTNDNLCLYHDSDIPKSVMNNLPCDTKVTGRYVTWLKKDFLGYLYLCEFEALAGAPVVTPPSFYDGGIPLESKPGRKMVVSRFHSQILTQPYPSVCVVTCLSAKSRYYQGVATVAQLNKVTGLCQCIIKPNFQNSYYYQDYDAGCEWFMMELDTST